MPRFKLSNGVKVQFTAEEEAQRDAEEQAWSDDTHNRKIRSLREERNRLLSECDWTDLPNSALTEEKKNEWKTYRQELRDLTNGLNESNYITDKHEEDLVYPTKPGA